MIMGDKPRISHDGHPVSSLSQLVFFRSVELLVLLFLSLEENTEN